MTSFAMTDSQTEFEAQTESVQSFQNKAIAFWMAVAPASGSSSSKDSQDKKVEAQTQSVQSVQNKDSSDKNVEFPLASSHNKDCEDKKVEAETQSVQNVHNKDSEDKKVEAETQSVQNVHDKDSEDKKRSQTHEEPNSDDSSPDPYEGTSMSPCRKMRRTRFGWRSMWVQRSPPWRSPPPPPS